ncbi:MBL fold metallo-hydrolase [Rubrobacter xylanophilus]|uniref:MBL fold metallo-hydrolase n=1 Tax=Rubrobacter xylanophilus TaxID=49319 RepID=UPI001FCA7E60|nr:MBL fold metallo-hydrolase [Rubrobacter xylanophilus]
MLSSGSSGNATYVEAEGRGVLVDAGLSCRRIRALLALVGRTLDRVQAVLLTHGHADHTAGVASLVRECGDGLRVVAAPGVGGGPRSEVVPEGVPFEVCGFEATFFSVPHDAATYGLRLRAGELCAAVATDLGEVVEETLLWMRGADAVVLEANHDAEWLRRGPYPARLKRRISSSSGHLSNLQAAEAAAALAPHGLKDLVLAHLSETNNSPARACGTVSRALRAAGHPGVRVRASLPGRPTPWIEVGAPVAGYRREAGQLFGVE